jgi:hypothetical protein
MLLESAKKTGHYQSAASIAESVEFAIPAWPTLII